MWITRLGQQLLFNLRANNAGNMALAAVVLIVVALLASYVPARQATKVDPMTALRCE